MTVLYCASTAGFILCFFFFFPKMHKSLELSNVAQTMVSHEKNSPSNLDSVFWRIYYTNTRKRLHRAHLLQVKRMLGLTVDICSVS